MLTSCCMALASGITPAAAVFAEPFGADAVVAAPLTWGSGAFAGPAAVGTPFGFAAVAAGIGTALLACDPAEMGAGCAGFALLAGACLFGGTTVPEAAGPAFIPLAG